jgi:cysteine desulfurase
VYLDNNATTALSREVQKKMLSVLSDHYGNPSSHYHAGRHAAAMIEEARSNLSDNINCDKENIYFTSCATEANNQVLKSLLDGSSPYRRKVITTPIEHPSVIKTLDYLETSGVEVKRIPVDPDGRIVPDEFERMIDKETSLVCCMLANNETGVIQDLARVGSIAHAHGVPVLADCVQALGKIEVDVMELDLDYATFSAHKLHGPKGIGAMYVKDQSSISNLIHGGHQESGLRPGTESVHNIVGFGEACARIPDLLENNQEILEVKAYLLTGLQQLKPDLKVNSPVENCLPNTLSITFPDINNALLMAIFDFNGIAVSAGSACSTGSTEPSHVLTALGLSDKEAEETIRFSLSAATRRKDIDYLLGIFRSFLADESPPIRALTPSQLDKDFIFNPDNFLLDIRFGYERLILKSIPNSHEASFIGFRKYLHHLPRDKHIVIICMAGFDATALAYQLYKKGYSNLSIVIGGVTGWRFSQSALYSELAGFNVKKLSPAK